MSNNQQPSQAQPSTRNLNPTPKQRFMESSDNIAKHRALVDSREFQRGVDFAKMEYTAQLMTTVQDPNSAANVGLKLLGVEQFLATFRLLSETIKIVPPTKPNDNLS